MTIHDLDTPALVIDLDIMERNLARAAEYARAHGLRLRPHTKTHKIPALGKRQLDHGAAGLSVAKTTEAEVMLSTGTADILIAYPVVGQRKIERLIELARRAYVTVALDSIDAARAISNAASVAGVGIGVLAEVDAGLHRVGVQPGELLPLVQSLSTMPNLLWEGITFYPGHVKSLGGTGMAQLAELRTMVPRIVEALESAALPPGIVSGGSTPLLWYSHTIPGLNEIRPGTYIFNDRNTLLMEACSRDDCAATMLCTVVSVQPGRMMIDGGSKTFSSDRCVLPGIDDFGEVAGAPASRFHKMNEEHGFVNTEGESLPFRVGDRVRILPNHICVAMNLHERVYGIRGDSVEEVWDVEARGKLQ